MGLISIKFDQEDFSSLSVNDHVYFVETNTRGDYIINSQTANYLGPVKTIISSKPVITRTFNLDRDHYTNFTITNGSATSAAGLNRLSTGHAVSGPIGNPQTFDFGNGNIAKKGDIITFASGQGALSAYTRTISSFININNELQYSLNLPIISVGDTISSIEFTTTSPHLNKIFTNVTDGIETDVYVSGGSLPGGSTPTTVVSAVDPNVSITLSNSAITSGSSTVELSFSHNQTVTDEPFEIVVYVANNDITLPVHGNNPYYFFIKDSSVNTSGLLGYYAEVKMVNNSPQKAELFSIGSEIFESSK